MQLNSRYQKVESIDVEKAIAENSSIGGAYMPVEQWQALKSSMTTGIAFYSTIYGHYGFIPKEYIGQTESFFNEYTNRTLKVCYPLPDDLSKIITGEVPKLFWAEPDCNGKYYDYTIVAPLGSYSTIIDYQHLFEIYDIGGRAYITGYSAYDIIYYIK